MIARADVFVRNGAVLRLTGDIGPDDQPMVEPTDDLLQMCGVATRCPDDDFGWVAGRDIDVRTSGGILAIVNNESCYIEITTGRHR